MEQHLVKIPERVAYPPSYDKVIKFISNDSNICCTYYYVAKRYANVSKTGKEGRPRRNAFLIDKGNLT